jgi:peptidoglycan/xylan/chitin deacetylase (PgdA/CDA1 family)
MDTSSESLSRNGAISTSRKILRTTVLAAASLMPLAATVPALAATPPIPVRAQLSQAGRRLVFSLRTSRPVALAGLDPRPGRGDSRYLCLELRRIGQGGRRRLCLGGAHARHRAGLEILNATGEVKRAKYVPAKLKRPAPQELVLAMEPEAAGLSPHRYRWRTLAGCASRGASGCARTLPAAGAYRFRLRPVRPVGCTGGGPGLVTNGPRDRRVVALTFDDGPSDYTASFLDVLGEKRVPATFFEIGVEMPGREATMRRILRAGDEIGDHTMTHAEYPGNGEISGAAERIAAATHFRPCLFRPPGGAVDSAVVATACSLGMRTITWDVDPADWSGPGSSTIYSRIVDTTQPGSIILMHDGGGSRSETLAALPRVIDTLRARGYSFATVTGLLGGRLLYRPYG